MTTATLAPGQRRNCVFVRNLGDPTKVYEKQIKNHETGDDVQGYVVEGKPIFRSGTFSDSMGIEHTWETLHINQMVDHASLLASRELFSDIPVRKGHPDWGGLFSDPVRNAMDELIGYMTNLRAEERVNPTDGATYTYLLADLEILEETAIKNIKSGLWRNVSAEISTYVTNNNAEYWPVMYGVAYVDIPAVEGLKSQHSKAQDKFSIILEENMAPEPTNPNPTLDHSKGGGTPQAFSVNGKSTTDYAAVQAHITQLESTTATQAEFIRESKENSRVEYVKGLVKDNKLHAAQEEGYIDYAKGLTDEAFGSWKGLMDAAAPMTITGAHGAGFSASAGQATEFDKAADRIDQLKGIIANHQMAGKSNETIKGFDSYKELMGLDKNFVL